MNPIRSCIVCRNKNSKDKLFRIVCENNIAIYDKNKNINSRGIYICKSSECIDKCKKYEVSHIEASTSMMQYNEMEYHSEIEEILLEHPEVDGIFASSDVIEAQTIQVCAKLGKRIPEDIKLVGFDDVLVSRLTSPQITTIHQPIKEMASLAVELLLKNKEDQVIPNRSILPVTLVERESTR